MIDANRHSCCGLSFETTFTASVGAPTIDRALTKELIFMQKKPRLIILLSLIISNIVFAESTYDWSGFYLGGFVGGGSGVNGSNSVDRSLNFEIGGLQPQFATSSSSNYTTKGSFMGGGTVGYNWQIGKTPYLIGLEGEYGYLGMSGTSQSRATASTLSYSTQNKTTIGSDFGYGLVGGSIGFALNELLFFVKSGAVFTKVVTTNSTDDIVSNQPV